MSDFSLILVDGNNFLYRAFHATFRVGLKNSLGEPTGAIKTFINMLHKLNRDYPNVPMAIVFDAKGKCFRHEIYEQYKANRKPMPEELRVQVPWIEQIIEAQGWPIIRIPGVEADDVLGSYAAQAIAQNKKLLIASGDKDLAALVQNGVLLVDTMKDEVIDREAVVKKYGVPPELIRDFLALKGDSSDNIPGMSGIGDVAATCILNNLGTLDEVQDNLDKVASLGFRGAKKFAENFLAQKDVVMLSRKLATIKTDVALPTSIEDFSLSFPNHTKLLELYRRFEFKELIRKEEQLLENQGCVISSNNANNRTQYEQDTKTTTILPDQEASAFLSLGKAECVTDEKTLEELVNFINLSSVFYYDIIDSSKDFMESNLYGIAFIVQDKNYYIPLRHSEFEIPGQLNISFVLSHLSKIFSNKNVSKITFDIKRSMHILKRHNIEIKGAVHDILIASHLIDSTNPHKLNELVKHEFDFQYKTEEEICGKGAKAQPLTEISALEVLTFIGYELSAIYNLYNLYNIKFNNDNFLKDIYLEQEIPLASVLFRMEENGVDIDTAEFKHQEQRLAQRMQAIEDQIYVAAGKQFNISSPSQVGQVLFVDLGMPCKKKSAGGKASTSEEVLLDLSSTYEVPRLILEYRALKKLLTTYIEKLPKLVNPNTHRLHGSFNQDGTVTGRLSSSEPNLQNIPVRTDDGRMVRTGFIAREGYVVLAADYSQIELRILAHMADETNMQAAFASGRDIHTLTAAQMHGIDVSKVTPELRRSAKAINFGLIYGMSTYGLAKQLNIENKLAKNYIATYFAQYPKVQSYMNEIKEKARQHGYVTTLSGRKIYIHDITSSQAMVRQAAERAAINAPIQGSAAEIIKKAMVAVDKWINLEAEPNSIKMIMQVHDELVFEVKAELAEEYASKIESIMSNVVSLKVKLAVDSGIGPNWSEAH